MKESIVLALMVVLAGSVWYHAWVKPHDEFLYAVMDCMAEMDDNSKEAYTSCARDVRTSL